MKIILWLVTLAYFVNSTTLYYDRSESEIYVFSGNGSHQYKKSAVALATNENGVYCYISKSTSYYELECIDSLRRVNRLKILDQKQFQGVASFDLSLGNFETEGSVCWITLLTDSFSVECASINTAEKNFRVTTNNITTVHGKYSVHGAIHVSSDSKKVCYCYRSYTASCKCSSTSGGKNVALLEGLTTRTMQTTMDDDHFCLATQPVSKPRDTSSLDVQCFAYQNPIPSKTLTKFHKNLQGFMEEPKLQLVNKNMLLLGYTTIKNISEVMIISIHHNSTHETDELKSDISGTIDITSKKSIFCAGITDGDVKNFHINCYHISDIKHPILSDKKAKAHTNFESVSISITEHEDVCILLATNITGSFIDCYSPGDKYSSKKTIEIQTNATYGELQMNSIDDYCYLLRSTHSESILYCSSGSLSTKFPVSKTPGQSLFLIKESSPTTTIQTQPKPSSSNLDKTTSNHGVVVVGEPVIVHHVVTVMHNPNENKQSSLATPPEDEFELEKQLKLDGEEGIDENENENENDDDDDDEEEEEQEHGLRKQSF